VKVIQTRLFARKVKKLSTQEKAVLDNEIRRIIADPSIGQEKRGTLKGVFIHKFKLHAIQFLLAYRFCDLQTLELIMYSGLRNLHS